MLVQDLQLVFLHGLHWRAYSKKIFMQNLCMHIPKLMTPRNGRIFFLACFGCGITACGGLAACVYVQEEKVLRRNSQSFFQTLPDNLEFKPPCQTPTMADADVCIFQHQMAPLLQFGDLLKFFICCN